VQRAAFADRPRREARGVDTGFIENACDDTEFLYVNSALSETHMHPDYLLRRGHRTGASDYPGCDGAGLRQRA
jgi:hypothetical protein